MLLKLFRGRGSVSEWLITGLRNDNRNHNFNVGLLKKYEIVYTIQNVLDVNL